MESFILITKENYSDGVSVDYEDIIWATDIKKAKVKAEIKINLRNEYLAQYGKCYFINLIKDN